ncbi:Clp protease N-terminal domain-containing protein [Pseudonocardia sp. H11422]|uniref:Clp protease N-terminal domain-containing protein n=1 Tax=Pseudonocardia sp. H11422 TaxID=2835866 RepID=UPI003977BD50
MFERFTDKARRAVVIAQEDARDRRDDEIRTEHLLMGLFGVPEAVAVTLLSGYGVDRAVVDAEIERMHRPDRPGTDAEKLAVLGIDLDEVRRQVDEAFGPGALDRTRAARARGGRPWSRHLPFHRAAKKAFELSLREALRLEHNHIGTEHILLGLLHTETGAAHHILAAHGVTLDGMRAAVADLGRGAASG